MPKSPLEDYYKVPELATALRVKPDVIYGFIGSGRLKAVNVSTSTTKASWRVSKSAWTAFLAGLPR
jgi:hypothetical protein